MKRHDRKGGVPASANQSNGYSDVPRGVVAHRWPGGGIATLAILLPLALLLVTGVMGVDFGNHWDEHIHYTCVQRTIQTGILLPGFYNYPSLTYWLVLGGTLPEMIKGLKEAEPAIKKFHDIAPNVCYQLNRDNLLEWAKGVNRYFGSREHILRVRLVFIVLSALTVVWVYWVVLMLGRGRLEAFLACCLQAFSWEVAYHSRWVTPDAVVMQFGALALLCCLAAVRCSGSGRWLVGAAVAAGCATAAKYTAGLLLVLVLQAAYMSLRPGANVWRVARVALGLMVVFGLVYLVISPGTILEPLLFWRFLVDVVRVNYDHGWACHTVNAGWEHWGRIVVWLSCQAFSYYALISLLCFGLGIIGAYLYLRKDRRAGLLILIFPLIVIGFMGLQWAMFARNLLIVVPFFAIMAARGFSGLVESARRRWIRMLLIGAMTIAITVNIAWLFHSASTIQKRGSDDFVHDFCSYLQRHPGQSFYVSEGVKKQMQALGREMPPNAVQDMNSAAYLCVYRMEVLAGENWFPANDPFMYVACFGPMVVNLNYYPDWAAWGKDDHILVFDARKFRKLKEREQLIRGIAQKRRQASGRNTVF